MVKIVRVKENTCLDLTGSFSLHQLSFVRRLTEAVSFFLAVAYATINP
jgi:hypothetical protein